MATGNMTEEYHFIRIISRESAAIYDMLKKCGYKFKDTQAFRHYRG